MGSLWVYACGVGGAFPFQRRLHTSFFNGFFKFFMAEVYKVFKQLLTLDYGYLKLDFYVCYLCNLFRFLAGLFFYGFPYIFSSSRICRLMSVGALNSGYRSLENLKDQET
jgi:hypothetical protein